MIQSLIPSPAAPGSTPLDPLLQSATQPSETPDFGALLAQSVLPAAPNDPPSPGPAALPVAVTVAKTEAASLAGPGNNLPQLAAPLPLPTLPLRSLTGAGPQLDVMPKVQTAPLAIAPTTSQQSAKRALSASRSLPANDAAKASAASLELEPAVQAGDPVVGDIRINQFEPQPFLPAELSLDSLPPLILAQSVPALPSPTTGPDLPHQEPQSTSPSPSSPRAQQPVTAGPMPAAQSVPSAAPQAALLRTAFVSPQPDQPAAGHSVQPPTSRVAGVLRIEVAPPDAVAAPVNALEKPVPAARRVALPETAPVGPMVPAPSAAVPGLAPGAPTLLPAQQPHDFAALVDRLVTAREAVQPQAATLTVTHAEFGPVELRFRHEAQGLAVSLASADPDFARTAAAAPPLAAPVSSASAAPTDASQSAANRDNPASSGGTAGGHARGQQSERRDEAARHFSHALHRAPARGTARRSGIFA